LILQPPTSTPFPYTTLFRSFFSKASASCQVAQCGHKVRTRRWAITPIKELDSKNGSIPISLRRVTAPMAVLVCKVDKTRCPVNEDRKSTRLNSSHVKISYAV